MPTAKSSTLFSRSNGTPLSNITNYQDSSQPSTSIYDFDFQADPFHSRSKPYYCPELESTDGFTSFEDLDNFSVYRRGGQTRSVASRSISRYSDVFGLEDISLGEEAELASTLSCEFTDTESAEATPKCQHPAMPLDPKASLAIVVTPPTPTKSEAGDHDHQERVSSTKQWIPDDDWNTSEEADLDEASIQSFDWVTVGDEPVEYHMEDVYAGICMDYYEGSICTDGQ